MKRTIKEWEVDITFGNYPVITSKHNDNEQGGVSLSGLLAIAGFLLIAIGLFPFSLQYHFIPYIMVTVGCLGLIGLLYWRSKKRSSFPRQKNDSDKTNNSENDKNDGNSSTDRKPINCSQVIVDDIQETKNNKSDKSDGKSSHGYFFFLYFFFLCVFGRCFLYVDVRLKLGLRSLIPSHINTNPPNIIKTVGSQEVSTLNSLFSPIDGMTKNIPIKTRPIPHTNKRTPKMVLSSLNYSPLKYISAYGLLI